MNLKNTAIKKNSPRTGVRFEFYDNQVWQCAISLPPKRSRGNADAQVYAIHCASRDLCPSAVIELITERYRQAFSARIEVTYPEITYVTDTQNRVPAALGLRSAASGALFLEQYLDQPVHTSLGAPRHCITEIGSLVSRNSAVTPGLFATTALLLNRRGVRYAVATGNHLLEKRLQLLGMKPRRLAPARCEQLNSHTDDWGNYYQSDPHVLCGSVCQSARYLHRVAGIGLGDTHGLSDKAPATESAYRSITHVPTASQS